jgi:fluoride exporter
MGICHRVPYYGRKKLNVFLTPIFKIGWFEYSFHLINFEKIRKSMFENSFWIAIGGAIGTLCRYWLTEAFLVWFGTGFPWGTVFINITGSFIVGFFSTLTGPDGRFLVPPSVRQFVMIGMCGGYTTFSAFSLQTLNMAQKGEWGVAGLHIAGSVIMCLLGVWLGALAATALNQLKGA